MNKRERIDETTQDEEHKRRKNDNKLDLSSLASDLRAIEPIESLRKINSTTQITNHLLIYATFTDDSHHTIAININNLSVCLDQKLVGFLRRRLSVNYDLRSMHSKFDKTCVCLIRDSDELEFVSPPDTQNNRIVVRHFLDRKNASYQKVKLGQRIERNYRSAKDLNELIDKTLAPSCQSVLGRYGFEFEPLYMGAFSYDAPMRLEDTLIADLLKANPRLQHRYKFTGQRCRGVFACDWRTNVWNTVSNDDVGDMLIDEIKKHIPSLNMEEREYLGKENKRKQFRALFCLAVKDTEFAQRLGTNNSVLPIGHQVVCRETGRLRPIRPDDYVSTHAQWTYDAELAARYRNEVREMVEKILPVESERKYALTYMATALHGRRTQRCFLILTDKRVGSNGKSTLMRAMQQVFGPFFTSNTKFVCRGSFQQDKDSHDAGMEKMRGIRVVCADELKKSSRLNESLLKALTGGDCQVEGRYMNRSDKFSFEFQAVFVLIFNEGDCPRFDATDGAFVERCRVVPMRSKFETRLEQDDAESLTFKVDRDLTTKFPLYRSALLDLLLEHRDESVLDQVPSSMREWRDEIFANENPLVDWLEDHLDASENPQTYVTLVQLWEEYAKERQKRYCSVKTFVQLAKTVLRQRGIEVAERYQPTIDGKQKNLRNVVFGYIFTR